MTTVTHEQTVDAPVKDVWRVLKDFGGFLDWSGTPGSVEGEGVGMIRHMETPDMGKWAETLDIADDETMSYGYTLVYGAPIGMGAYVARARLEAKGDSQSKIFWKGEFEPVDGADAESVAAALRQAYEGMTGGIEAQAKK